MNLVRSNSSPAKHLKVDESHPLYGASLSYVLPRIFFYYIRIALFVVGGGYAIIIASEEIFERRLKWLKPGELMNMLPVFQTVPGLIAGNSAMYVGWRIAGFLGAISALVGVVIPSFFIILLIAHGFSWLPMDNAYVQGAFVGVRSALSGVVLATILRTWKNVMRGVYAYISLPLCCILMLFFGVRAVYVLVGSILFGIVYMAIVLPLYKSISGKERGDKQ